MWAQNRSIMTQENAKKIHRIYGGVLSILLLASGIALMAACLHIYHSGDRPYSPASIDSHFQTIAVVIYLAIAGIAGGIVLDLVLPVQRKRPKAVISEDILLARQQSKVTLSGGSALQAGREEKLRRVYILTTIVLFCLLMICPTGYFSDLDHFTVTDLNGDVVTALAISLIPAVVGLGLCYLCRHLCTKSYLRQIDICKEAAKEGASSPLQNAAMKERSHITTLRWTVGIIAALFIVVGIFNGGASDVLLKAIAICTECIGLG